MMMLLTLLEIFYGGIAPGLLFGIFVIAVIYKEEFHKKQNK